MTTFDLAREADAAGDRVSATMFLQAHINDNIRDYSALYVLANFHLDAGNHGEAYNLFCRVAGLRPDIPHGFVGMGRCLEELSDFEGALECHMKAFERDNNDYHALHNVGLNLMKLGKHDEAETWVTRALEVRQDQPSGFETLGMIYLKQGRYKEAWPLTEVTQGLNDRREPIIGKRWDDEAQGSLLIYAEQGIGDEVFFAQGLQSFLDAYDKLNTTTVLEGDSLIISSGMPPILEADPRLVGLFNRSFGVPVYPRGDERTQDADYRMSCTSVMRWHDVTPMDAFLKPDPDRVRMVKALLDPLPRPWVGVAWSGGTHGTQRADRSMSEEKIRSLVDAETLISLQYNGESEYTLEYPFLTRTDDYDDTAALVACLDHVVSVPTSVVNLAGALGTPATVLLPDRYPHWRYGNGDKSPFFESVSIHRENGEWQSVHIPNCRPLAQTG